MCHPIVGSSPNSKLFSFFQFYETFGFHFEINIFDLM
jgi:hypothetical protein